MEGFYGYKRADGSVGTRNYVGVISCVVCVNEVVERIASQVQGAVRFTHSQGCGQTMGDVHTVERTLASLGLNPNLHSVLLVSLGCESTDIEWVEEEIKKSGKRVERVVVQQDGGSAKAAAKGILLVQDMVIEASKEVRELCPLDTLVLGLKCGSSDTTSGLIPNPAAGIVSDMVVAAGGTSVLGEVTEFVGAEHILVRHAASGEVAAKILELVARMEKRAMAMGEDIRGGQPTQGNIKGGLTTIEEKSLGAIAKAGSAPIQAVYEYGERPDVKGLVIVNSPGKEPEILTALAAAGCNVIIFATGRGAPQGFPFVPVLKVTGSRTAARMMSDHIDMELSSVIFGDGTIQGSGEAMFKKLISIASGELTKAEIIGYSNSMDIYTVGPVI
jgi:altronate dehydratase large subunit